MTDILPRHTVPPAPASFHGAAGPDDWDWSGVPELPPFILADGSAAAIQKTVARVCFDSDSLFVRFDCQDRDIWGTYTQQDDPIYDEEVVEVFLAPGQDTPVDYYELEISPNSVLLDVKIHNPGGGRDAMLADFAWNCPGLRWAAYRDDAGQSWWAALAIPWVSVGVSKALPRVWRANLYRIERPARCRPRVQLLVAHQNGTCRLP